jgi:hypothetical protein
VSVQWRFDIKNFNKVADDLEALAADLHDLSPYFKKYFIPAYLQTMQLQFATEGGLTGGWDGLDPTYERWKRSHSRGRLIGQRTGRLKNSFAPGGRSKYLELRIGPRSAVIRTMVDYAFWFNQTRQLMVPGTKLNRQKYTRLLEEYLQTLLKKHGFDKPRFSTAEVGRLGGGGSFLS